MKPIAVLSAVSVVVLLAGVLSYSSASSSHFGFRQPGDRMLYQERVLHKSSWFTVLSHNVAFPPKGYYNYNTLTFINVTDHKPKSGGYARLVQGGIYKRNATINLTSQRGHGLNFTVQFYGF